MADQGSGSSVEGGVARRAGLYLGARAVQMLAYVAVLPLLTRRLEEAEFGEVSLALVIHQALLAVAALGLPSVVAWDVYERSADALVRASRLIVAATLVATASAGVALATGPAWSSSLGRGGLTATLVVAVIAVIPFTFQSSCLTVLQAEARPVAFVAVILVTTAGGQLAALVLLSISPSPTSYFLGVAGGGVAGAALAGILLPLSSLRIPPRPELGAALRHGAPTVPHVLGFMVLALADRILVERELGLAETARYQAAYTVGALVIGALYAVNNAWGPAIYALPEPDRWQALARTANQVLAAVAVAVTGLALVGPIAMRVVAPASYRPDELVGVAVLVASAAAFDAIYLSAAHVLFRTRRTASLLLVAPAAAVTNIGLNLLLLPHFGLGAAAVSTVAGYAVAATVGRWSSRRIQPIEWRHVGTAASLAVCAAAVALGAYGPTSTPALVVRAVAGAGLAGAVFVLVRRRFAGNVRSEPPQEHATDPSVP